jgi:hypothetical protein
MPSQLISPRVWSRFEGWPFEAAVERYLERLAAAGYRQQSLDRAVRVIGDSVGQAYEKATESRFEIETTAAALRQ